MAAPMTVKLDNPQCVRIIKHVYICVKQVCHLEKLIIFYILIFVTTSESLYKEIKPLLKESSTEKPLPATDASSRGRKASKESLMLDTE